MARIHPDDLERVRRSTQQSMAAEATFEREYRILRGDGQVRWITSRGRVERDAAGAVASMHGVSFDMTRVRRADAMFRAALEAAPERDLPGRRPGPDPACQCPCQPHVRLRERGAAEPAHGHADPGVVAPAGNAPARPGPLPLLERRGSTRELLARRRDSVPVPVELA
jgi:hypothetical protein